MVRKLETGEYLLERDGKTRPANRIRPLDTESKARQEDNKNEVFRRS